MSQIEELRRLIIGDNSGELAELKNRIENIDARTRDVAEVLAPAIDRGVKDSNRLVNALKKPVSVGLKQAIRAEPNAYAEIIYPAIAPSIRLAISQAISSLLVTINQTIASATSVSGLRTRYQSFRTGVPYAELALLQSLIYRVEHIYLIDRDSGLLIAECASSDDDALDSDAVSAMFSAIQSFVQDSFSGNAGDRLTDFKVGAHNVWIVHGPKAMLACVILGNAPESLKSQLYDRLDLVRIEYAQQLESFDGDYGEFAGIEEHLQPLLQMRLREGFETASKTRNKMSTASKLLLVAMFASALYLFVQWFERHSSVSTVRHYLASTPGMVVTKVFWEDGNIVVEGLQDPDARLPYGILAAHQVNEADLDLRTVPFRSLQGEMEMQRFADELQPPEGVVLSSSSGLARLDGAAPLQWLLLHDHRLRQLAADKRLNLGSLIASESSVRGYLKAVLINQPASLQQELASALLSKPWDKVSLSRFQLALANSENSAALNIPREPRATGTEAAAPAGR